MITDDLNVGEQITLLMLDIATAVERWAQTPRPRSDAAALAEILDSHATALHNLASALAAATKRKDRPR
jgi:hypothetical protein